MASSSSGPGPSSVPTPPPPPRKSRVVACAECRRLKLKCDRTFPCLNCRRREVAKLCPNGSLVTRSRLSTAVADGTQKNTDVTWMSERIKKLEEALALVQSKVSEEPHPLLSESTQGDGSRPDTPEPSATEGFSGQGRAEPDSADNS
ncbi:hypothetical protein K439DRAFT_1413134 [Ramaria rubella]|nr:hypothetical protein K439DRAFT_1413134 [Ramaria rubella]